MAGYVDLQVNGYAGVDFNADHVSEEQILSVCEQLRRDGNSRILATIITAPLESMLTRIGHIADLIEKLPDVASMIAGIHVEGPFLNPEEGFVGAHPREATMPASVDVANQLLGAGRGHVLLMTLAPERDPDGVVTEAMTEAGIVMAAGHSDASIDELQCAVDHGLRLYTHLGNGCPALLARHDNIIQRVLSLSDRLSISFIADGHHVPPPALGNYLRCVPNENIIIVTDAISAAGLGPGRYELADQVVEVDEDGAAWSACRTHFAGCASTLPQMVDVLKNRVGVSDEDIDQWLRVNPSRLLDSATAAIKDNH